MNFDVEKVQTTVLLYVQHCLASVKKTGKTNFTVAK